jgi:phage FluMu protein Com
MSRKFTLEDFIIKSKVIHGDKYDYSLVNYENIDKKVEIVCSLHGSFYQTPNGHINRKSGCSKCNIVTADKFINKCNIVHKNLYTYDKLIYKNNKERVIITCSIHGDFSQVAACHLRGTKCPKCKKENAFMTLETFINKSIILHDNNYSYEKSIYINNTTPLIIICKEHGEFFQKPNPYLAGSGCHICAYKVRRPIRYDLFEDYIKECNKVHNNYYNYEKFIYKKWNAKSIIICPKHGEFLQTMDSHKQGSGCIKCSRSKGELEISKYLEQNNILFQEQKRFPDCKNIYPLPFDFYLLEYNLLIEYSGKQHYEIVEYFKNHNLQERQRLDAIKKSYALSNGYNFLEITYKQNIEEELNKYFNLITI